MLPEEYLLSVFAMILIYFIGLKNGDRKGLEKYSEQLTNAELDNHYKDLKIQELERYIKKHWTVSEEFGETLLKEDDEVPDDRASGDYKSNSEDK